MTCPYIESQVHFPPKVHMEEGSRRSPIINQACERKNALVKEVYIANPIALWRDIWRPWGIPTLTKV